VQVAPSSAIRCVYEVERARPAVAGLPTARPVTPSSCTLIRVVSVANDCGAALSGEVSESPPEWQRFPQGDVGVVRLLSAPVQALVPLPKDLHEQLSDGRS
jgi:hypothetical protein